MKTFLNSSSSTKLPHLEIYLTTRSGISVLNEAKDLLFKIYQHGFYEKEKRRNEYTHT